MSVRKSAKMSAKEVLEIKDRDRRMQWWREARFGMFIHWGLYSQLARCEWAMNVERIPKCEYEKLADSWHPRPGVAREWAKLAVESGAKYMVLTTKHHEGFSLWDSKLNPYNAVNYGPGRDLVREFVDACRQFGLKVGLYYSLMDWHHPDGYRCVKNEKARRRFVDYTHGMVRELMSNYGKIDILWYDIALPLNTAKQWESVKLNKMVRQIQPDIIINNRAWVQEDFGTPEGHIKPDSKRDWESCMTFNGSWGWMDVPAEDWLGVRQVLDMLRQASAGGGNLLLNVGPKADGTVPDLAVERLVAVGKWLKVNGEAVYGKMERCASMRKFGVCAWTLRNVKTAYMWVHHWPGEQIAIGGPLKAKVRSVSYLTDGRPIEFHQEGDRLVLTGLPAKSPDKIAGVTILKVEFSSRPDRVVHAGYQAK